MTTALLESAAADRLFEESGAEAGAEAGGRVTLEERLNATWRALRADCVAECPVCHSRVRLENDHGDCEGCGSRLA